MTFPGASEHEPLNPWRQHLGVGAGCEHAGQTDMALVAYADSLAAAATDEQRAASHVRIACVHRTRSEWDDARKHAEQALTFARACQSDDLTAEAINVEVGIHIYRGELDEALALAEQAMVLAREPRQRGISLQHLATIAGRRGDLLVARARLEESLKAFREAKYQLGITYSLVNAAVVAMDSGELLRALDLGHQAIDQARAMRADDLLLTAVQNQSHVMVKLGWYDKAQTMLTEAFGFFTTAHNPIRQAECLEIMSELSSMRTGGDQDAAVRSLTLAKELAKAAGDKILLARITAKLEKFARYPSPTR